MYVPRNVCVLLNEHYEYTSYWYIYDSGKVYVN